MMLWPSELVVTESGVSILGASTYCAKAVRSVQLIVSRTTVQLGNYLVVLTHGNAKLFSSTEDTTTILQ